MVRPELPSLPVLPASFGWCSEAGSHPDSERAEEGAPGVCRGRGPFPVLLFLPRWADTQTGLAPRPWPSGRYFHFSHRIRPLSLTWLSSGPVAQETCYSECSE